MEFLKTLCIILFGSLVISHISNRLKIPAVVGQLLLGILLGPALLNWLQPDRFMHYFSEIGVILLMFLAGLESDLGLLKKYFKPSLLVGILGIIAPIIFIYFLTGAFDVPFIDRVFLGIVFSATSVSITVEVLKEMRYLDGKEGTTVLGAAVVDDVLAIMILSFFLNSVGGEKQGGNSQMLMTIMWQLLFFVGCFVAIKWLVPHIVKLTSKIIANHALLLVALIVCFGMAYLADLAGISAVVGAFFAGIAIGRAPQHKEVEKAVDYIGYGLFIPAFFISIGLNMTFHNMQNNLWLIISLTIVAVLTKLFGSGLGAKLAKFDWNSSYIVGAGMIARGEMALIVAQIGFQSKIVSEDLYSTTIIAIILTTVIAPFILKHAVSRIRKAKK